MLPVRFNQLCLESFPLRLTIRWMNVRPWDEIRRRPNYCRSLLNSVVEPALNGLGIASSPLTSCSLHVHLQCSSLNRIITFDRDVPCCIPCCKNMVSMLYAAFKLQRRFGTFFSFLCRIFTSRLSTRFHFIWQEPFSWNLLMRLA